jgi:FKBP-type peptidyl-prolyl cis-trans isomerase
MVVSKDKQRLEDVNKYLSDKELDVLQAYVQRQQLKMERTASGYYMELLKAGKGNIVAAGDAVRLVGKVWLLDGMLCYVYDIQHPLELVVNGSAGITGLHMAAQGLKEGSKVRLLFPSYLAYGLMGDGDKIPPRSAIVCEFEVVKVAKNSYSTF